MAEPLVLHDDRFFDPDPSTRSIARELFAGIRDLPIVSPHGHVDPRILAENTPFPEPAALIVQPDHYILRMLYSRGVPLESLGVGTRVGSAPDADPRAVWKLFAGRYHLFRATPTGAWIDHELHEVFGIRVRLTAETADRLYDEISEKLNSPEFLPRALYDRFGIEVIATTDSATDSLEHHAAIRSSDWHGRVIPTFRPDRLLQIAAPGWPAELSALESLTGARISALSDFVRALESRRTFFREMGATATDHGTEEPFTTLLASEEAERIFQRARAGEADAREERSFQGHMLIAMARMSVEDGMVMQLHAGSLRDHNGPLRERFGPNVGGDIPVATEYTRNLRPLLNQFGNDPRFRLILFTLDESTYSRELAPLAGHYPAVLLGPPWWFHDSAEGMRRYRERTTETAGIHNTAGFNDDTRGFCSIPARHDLSRRIDSNWLAGLVARHVLEMDQARELAKALAYDLARRAYRLDESSRGPARTLLSSAGATEAPASPPAG